MHGSPGKDVPPGKDASRGQGNVAGVEPAPTIPLMPLPHGTASVPVAGGLPASSGFSMGGSGFSPGRGGFAPGSGEVSPANAGLPAVGETRQAADSSPATDEFPAIGEPAAGLPWLTRALHRADPRTPASPVRTRLSIFRHNPRLAWGIRHAAGAACVGIAVALLTVWPIGLAAGLLAAAADTMYRTRTSPVVPPAARALSAQRRTKRRLSRLSSAGYLSLHARHLPGTGIVIDHLVVGPAGLYLMDSQRWDRRLPVRAGQGGRLFHGPFDQSGRIEYARRVAAQVSMLISQALGHPITIHPAMVIHGPTVPWVVARISGVDVFCGHRLRRYLRREKSANKGQCLTERQIVYLHAVASQLLPPARGIAVAGQHAD
jgi:Nuclease-related domain